LSKSELQCSINSIIFQTPDFIHSLYFQGRQTFADFRVLVVGGGTGSSLLYLAEQLRHVASAQLVYLDFSWRSLEIARQRARLRGLKNIRWVHNSIENIGSLRDDLGKRRLIFESTTVQYNKYEYVIVYCAKNFRTN
jgi:SAM-dependent methyltransferase